MNYWILKVYKGVFKSIKEKKIIGFLGMILLGSGDIKEKLNFVLKYF